MKNLFLVPMLGVCMFIHAGICQKNSTAPYLGEPIITDSLSTLFIPLRYSQEFLADNKIAFWGDYYANLLVYDYKADRYKKLFEQDTYIEAFNILPRHRYSYESDQQPMNLTRDWVFLLVKIRDYNNSGRIDERDPSVLFICNLKGENLKALTDETENVVSFQLFDKQGFCLIKIQRDINNNRSFTYSDKDFYYRKLNLADLTFGQPIESQ